MSIRCISEGYGEIACPPCQIDYELGARLTQPRDRTFLTYRSRMAVVLAIACKAQRSHHTLLHLPQNFHLGPAGCPTVHRVFRAKITTDIDEDCA